MKNKIFLLLLFLFTISFLSAQEKENFKKHEIGIDLFPINSIIGDRELSNFNVTYKYYFNKYAVKLRVGGSSINYPENEHTSLTYRNNNMALNTIGYSHYKANANTFNEISTTIGVQYNYLTTKRNNFFVGFDIRGSVERSIYDYLSENYNSNNILQSSTFKSYNDKKYSLGILSSFGYTFKFKQGFGITYEITYGYNFHLDHLDDKTHLFSVSNFPTTIDDNQKHTSVYGETDFNIFSNLTLSYRF